MALQWNHLTNDVTEILAANPPRSGRCLTVAARLAVMARPGDPTTTMIRISPAFPSMRYVLPKPSVGGAPWDFHVTTLTELHAIDALTGAGGVFANGYLREHFHYADALQITEEPMS